MTIPTKWPTCRLPAVKEMIRAVVVEGGKLEAKRTGIGYCTRCNRRVPGKVTT